MKRNTKTLLLLSALTFSSVLVSCGGESNLSSSISESTTLEIAGATSVLKGKTIQLVSTFDDVTWSTSDEYIAAVDQNGLVTGIEAGVVTIRVTSNQDETIYAETTITVYLHKAESINAELKGDEVTLVSENTYNVPLGKVFDVYVSVKEGYSIPDFSYEIQYPTGSDVDNVVTITPDPNNPGHATIVAYYDLVGMTLICKGSYQDLATATLIKSVVFNVIDKNKDNLNEVNNFVTSYKTTEKDSLLSYKSNQTLRYEDGAKSSSSYENVSSSTYSHYEDSSYVLTTNTRTPLYGNGETTSSISNHYQGVKVNNNSSTYYSFDYNEDKEITKLYNNEAVNEMNKNNIHFAMNANNSSIYGVSGLLDSILNSTENIYDNIISIGNIYAYANSEFEISSDKIVITSNFVDMVTDLQYDIKLSIIKDDSRITSLTYEQTIKGSNYNEDGDLIDNYTYTFVEEFTDFVYGTKVNDTTSNSDYLNITDYYMTSYDLVELAGKQTDVYNYTDLTKYGSNAVSVENGITKYTLTTDKTLVLKVDNYTPNNASTLIDRVTASSSDADQIPNVTLTGSDVFSINARKDDNSISQPGIATFTFKSTLGIEKQIIVEFVKAELKSVFTSNVPYNNDFGTIFINDLSSYFFINTFPDEDLYSFGIEMIEGEEGGLELYEHQNDNLDGIPGFAYSIKGLKVGTYKFRIYVIENPDIKTSTTYKIKVEDVYFADYIKSNIVDNTVIYRYSTGMVEYDMRFKSETLLEYTYRAYGDEITKNINYHIEDGRIIIDEDQNLGNNAYYSWIKGGDLKFAKDFSSITFYLEAYYENDNEELANLRHYYAVSFTKVVDKSDFASYINNKTFVKEDFIYGGVGMAHLEVSFNDGVGTLTIIPNESSPVTITFDYSYNSSTYELSVSNIKSSNSSYTLGTSAEFNQYNDTLKINVNYKGEANLIYFNV